jgi:hypothetical protein
MRNLPSASAIVAACAGLAVGSADADDVVATISGEKLERKGDADGNVLIVDRTGAGAGQVRVVVAGSAIGGRLTVKGVP